MNNQFIRSALIDWRRVQPGSYLHSIPSLSGVEQIDFSSSVTFFVGENGSGKSTLLEAIAVAYGFNPEGGTRNYHFSTYDSHSELCTAVRLSRSARKPVYGYFLRAESFYNVATMEEEYSKGPGGIPHTFRENGIYLLDEPEAALSPQRQLTLLMEIHRCAQGGAQFIIASHSPILLGLPGAEILSFDDGVIHPCTYEETDSYQVTEVFINHREHLLHNLLNM